MRVRRRRQSAFFAYVLLLAFLCGCVSQQRTAVTLEGIKSAPGKSLDQYDFDPSSTLVQRIKPMPEYLLQHYKEVDNTEAYSSYIPSGEETEMISYYVALLPPMHRRILTERLVGIYFVNEFIGSGLADFLFDDEDRLYTIMVFNPETMRHSISEWMTARELSCFDFEGHDDIQIEVQCGDKFTGFLYILLHESTHVVDYVSHFTPFVEPLLKQLGMDSGTAETAFTSGVWDGPVIPFSQYDFPARKDVTFYGFWDGPRLEADQASSVYESLKQSPFVSLYASMNWAEDFAEFVTWYHFTSVLRQPYELMITVDGEIVGSYAPMECDEVRKRIPIIADIYE